MRDIRSSGIPETSTWMYRMSPLPISATTRRGTTFRFWNRSRTRDSAPRSASAVTRSRNSAEVEAGNGLSALMNLQPRTGPWNTQRNQAPAFRESRARNASNVLYEAVHGSRPMYQINEAVPSGYCPAAGAGVGERDASGLRQHPGSARTSG